MKKLLFLFIFAISGLFLACDNVKDQADITFETDVVTTWAVSASNSNVQTLTIVADATTDSEISKYADKITNYEVSEVWFAIDNYSSDQPGEIYFNGDLGFGSKTGSAADATCSVSNLNITHWSGTGEFQFNDCQSTIPAISNALSNDNAVKVYMIGSFTKAPLSFTLKVRMKMKVTANPL